LDKIVKKKAKSDIHTAINGQKRFSDKYPPVLTFAFIVRKKQKYLLTYVKFCGTIITDVDVFVLLPKYILTLMFKNLL